MMDKCNECNQQITLDELENSLFQYMRPLCHSCQQDGKVSKGTPQQQKLCRALRLAGYESYAEWFDGVKYIDIAIPNAMVNIEVDGSRYNNQDRAVPDQGRTYYSYAQGCFTLRIPASLLENDFNKAVGYIVNLIQKSQDQILKPPDLEQTREGRIFAEIITPSIDAIQDANEYLIESIPYQTLDSVGWSYDQTANLFTVSYLGEWSLGDQSSVRSDLQEIYGIDIDFQEI